MAMIVKSAPLFVGSLKLAELRELSCTFKANGELIVLSEEVIKTKGVTTSEISFETVVPVTGLSINLFSVTIKQVGVTIVIPFNGAVYSIDGSFDEATFKSIVQSGASTGSFKFTGGTPKET